MLLFGQILVGALNVWLDEYEALIVLHLALGTLLWATVVGARATALSRGCPFRPAREPARGGEGGHRLMASRATRRSPRSARLGGLRQVASDYLELTKPKVQSLLILTTVTTMYVAGDPSLDLVAAHLPGRLPVGRWRGRGQPLVRPRHRRAR